MAWKVPDRTEDHYPQGACPCGRDLADATDLGVTRSYQQEEIPATVAGVGVPDRGCVPWRFTWWSSITFRGAVPAADR
jgi:hypothetical protein